MITVLALALIIGIISAIYWGIWHGTRTKLSSEDKKIEYLESQYNFLKGLEFDSKIDINNFETEKIIDVFKKSGFKKGKVEEISASIPYNDKSPWKVYATVKSGTWPFNDKQEDVLIFSIYDSDLSKLV